MSWLVMVSVGSVVLAFATMLTANLLKRPDGR